MRIDHYQIAVLVLMKKSKFLVYFPNCVQSLFFSIKPLISFISNENLRREVMNDYRLGFCEAPKLIKKRHLGNQIPQKINIEDIFKDDFSDEDRCMGEEEDSLRPLNVEFDEDQEDEKMEEEGKFKPIILY